MEEEKKIEEEQEEPSEAVEEPDVEEKVDEAPEEETEETKEEQVSGEEAAAEEVKEEESAEEKGAVGEAAKAEAEGEEAPTPVEEEEAKPPREKKAEEEKEIVEEKVYTIPLGKAWIMPSNRRASRAVRMIREFVVKNMKLEKPKGEEVEEEEPKKLVISGEVNERVWGRGMQKPPRNIRVRAAKDKDGNVTVYLAEGD